VTSVLALIGVKALYLLYIWLASSIIASQLSARKGYGEKAGLATGLLLSAVAIVVWLLWPAKADSRWKLQGPLGRKAGGESVAAARAHMEDSKGS
jgi:glucose-6-phosphate dehydrogenase assembly protein OpcA